MDKPIQLLVVYTHNETVSNTLTQIDTDIQIVAQVNNSSDAVQLCHDMRPDVILMDFYLSEELNGIETTCVIHNLYPHIQTLGFSSNQDKDTIQAFLRAGAKGYVFNHVPSEDLSQIIRTIYAGKTVFSPEIARILLA